VRQDRCIRIQVFAGSDTTAVVLRAILHFVIKIPEKLAKSQQEIDGKALAGELSDRKARELMYLSTVGKE
jgi:cytochrome P450